AVSGLQLSRIDANKRKLTDKWISHDFESERRKRLIVGGLAYQLFLRMIRISAFSRQNINRGRKVINHGVQQCLHAFVLEGCSTEYREQLQRDHALAQRGSQLFRTDGFAFQEFVQNVVIVFRDALDQLRAESLGFLQQLRRN